MRKVIMIGCDLHDKTMLLKIAEGRSAPETRSVKNTASGRKKMIASLKKRSMATGEARVVFVYEASGLGFGLHDELTDAGIECHVLAPTRIARSLRQKSQKTDEKDAQQLLELLRAHILAGNELPTVWIPDATIRDDRELMRMRIDVSEKNTAVKSQIKSLLKRNHIARAEGTGKGWTRPYRGWLKHELCEAAESPLRSNGKSALASLIRQLDFLEEEGKRLTELVNDLASEPRYEAAYEEMTSLCGVSLMTAMVFLTELGDLNRFKNRRQLAAYLGLAPRSSESGEANDRKGHITRQGSSRIRKMLCQATWSRVRYDEQEGETYQRLVAKNPKKKKIAVVASMRRLAVRMWHRGKEFQGKPSRGMILAAEAGGRSVRQWISSNGFHGTNN